MAWELLAGSRTLLIATHANPDADAVASVLALRLVLAEHVQSAVCLTGDGLVPPNLEFLPGAEHLLRDPTSVTDPPDCIALLDCADPTRLGPLFRLHPAWFDGHIPIVNIDHHVTNTRYGSVIGWRNLNNRSFRMSPPVSSQDCTATHSAFKPRARPLASSNLLRACSRLVRGKRTSSPISFGVSHCRPFGSGALHWAASGMSRR